MAKRKKDSTELKNLKKLMSEIPDNKKGVANNILSRLEFLSDTLEKLQVCIENDGTIEDFKQGKQEFTRESPALKSYNKTFKSYTIAYKQLLDLIPKQQAQKEIDDGFDDFTNGRENV